MYFHSISEIDDGTGVISVVHFMAKRIASQNQRQLPDISAQLEKFRRNVKGKANQTGQSLALSSLVVKAQDCLGKSRVSYKVGTCVEAKGCIQHFNGDVQLLAFSVREIDNPNQEMMRYIRLDHLKKKVYPAEFYTGLK